MSQLRIDNSHEELLELVEQLRRSEERYHKMIAEIEDYAIILMDENGIIQNWNKGAEKIKQYHESEIVGKHFSVFYLPEDLDRNLPEILIGRAKEMGRASQEGWRRRKDGSRFWGCITITALHGANNNVIGYSKVTRDLTEQKLADDIIRKSEEQYHRMVSEVEDYAIILLNPDGIVQNWNKGAEKIKQYKEAEIVGRHFSVFYLPEDKQKGVPQRLLGEARTRGKASQEGWRIRKDGSLFWGSVTITALHAKNNDIIGYSKVTRDLTERKLAEDVQKEFEETLRKRNAELEASEERYHRMISEVKDYAIILLDVEGNIQSWNAGAQAIKGYSEEILGKNFSVFYTEPDRIRNLPETLLEKAKTSGRATHEGWRVRKDGTTFWGSIVITALHDNDGVLIGFSKVTRDLTEKKIAEDQLRAYTAQLEVQNRELEQFAYIASHDLQEPLRKIRTFAEIIQTNIGDMELVTRYFDKISRSAERMSDLIKSVLNYSRLSKDRSDANDVDLNNIVNDVRTDFELVIAEKNASLICDTLPVIRANGQQLSQLFANIIGNALKFTDKKPVVNVRQRMVSKKDIVGTISHLPHKEYLEITIADNGIGFEKQYANQIFAMFQRLHGKQDYAGTGIGLALCKKIIENHDGHITVTSELGQGSTFYLYFPANIVQ